RALGDAGRARADPRPAKPSLILARACRESRGTCHSDRSAPERASEPSPNPHQLRLHLVSGRKPLRARGSACPAEKSHYSIGLQCADLVVAATAATERGVGQGRGYVRKVEPLFARHPSTGSVEGVGLKRFPEREPRER